MQSKMAILTLAQQLSDTRVATLALGLEQAPPVQMKYVEVTTMNINLPTSHPCCQASAFVTPRVCRPLTPPPD
jgi:hypothetical protein